MRLRLSSTDPTQYYRISTTINALPACKYSRLTVTALTANCNIQVLASSDYMTLSLGGTSHTIQFSDYTSLNMESWIQLLNDAFTADSISITASNDNCGRVVLSASEEMSLYTMSYNVKQLMGLYSMSAESFPLVSELSDSTYQINVDSCPYFLSTPVLHLLSNIGECCYMNSTTDVFDIQSASVVMTLPNSFTESMPIICSNGEISTVMPTNSITAATFYLVDANMTPVKLLNPMYILLQIDGMEDRDE